MAKDPHDKLTVSLADTIDPKGIGINAHKVVYQFVGNNHMQRTNNLIFFTRTPGEARELAEKFLRENNLPWYKILSVQLA